MNPRKLDVATKLAVEISGLLMEERSARSTSQQNLIAPGPRSADRNNKSAPSRRITNNVQADPTAPLKDSAQSSGVAPGLSAEYAPRSGSTAR